MAKQSAAKKKKGNPSAKKRVPVKPLAAKKKDKEIPRPPFLTPEDRRLIVGIALLGSSAAILMSLLSFAYGSTPINWLGLLGDRLGWALHGFIGVPSYLIAPFIGWMGWRLTFGKSLRRMAIKGSAYLLLLFSLCLLLTTVEETLPNISSTLQRSLYPSPWSQHRYPHLGGATTYFLYRDMPSYNLAYILNAAGALVISAAGLAVSVCILTKTKPQNILAYFHPWRQSLIALFSKRACPLDEEIPRGKESKPKEKEKAIAISPPFSALQSPATELEIDIPLDFEEKDPPPKPKKTKDLLKTLSSLPLGPTIADGAFTSFTLPPPTLLTHAKKVDQTQLKKMLQQQSTVLEETLASFGIEAKVGEVHCGPTIVSFEVQPAVGVKVQKIKALENDLALNLKAKSLRILAPIPGKAFVGIEVPNPLPQEVSFKEMLLAYQQANRKFHIPLLLGKAVNGEYVMSDLAKMPHCIIAGATGSGKSVCINTIVMSIVMNAKPDQIKLVMVDPKKVELTPYSRLPHMLAPVITEPKGASTALKWLVKEMERRYDILKFTGTRNIEAFNSRKIATEAEAESSLAIPEQMYYIVAIIDELADLMMVSSSDIETPIARIAQMARAVGIHLILATQRPSREVITGLIKANFPTRISFKVASRVNSQIILDDVGAETLLGNGDMLFLPPGTSQLVRAQGAYIRDSDIQAVVEQLCAQAAPNYLIASFDELLLDDTGTDGEEEESADPLYKQAVEVVTAMRSASTTLLQRKLKIGYARAASLMDLMERKGVIGPSEGSKPRQVLAKGARPDEDF